MRFHAAIALHGKSATGIEVPADVVAALEQGKRPKVTVTINGYSYPSTVGVMGGVSLIPVSADASFSESSRSLSNSTAWRCPGGNA